MSSVVALGVVLVVSMARVELPHQVTRLVGRVDRLRDAGADLRSALHLQRSVMDVVDDDEAELRLDMLEPMQLLEAVAAGHQVEGGPVVILEEVAQNPAGREARRQGRGGVDCLDHNDLVELRAFLRAGPLRDS